jgi:hypothetical protein
MKTRFTVLLGALLFTAGAVAGMRTSQPVVVTLNADGSGTAIGSMVTARFSANTLEYAGCGVRYTVTAAGTTKWGFCQAATSTGVTGFCNIESNDLFQLASSLSDYSFLTFNWNAAGICTRIGMSTQSFYIP